jgi:hypothetical protein
MFAAQKLISPLEEKGGPLPLELATLADPSDGLKGESRRYEMRHGGRASIEYERGCG